MLIHNGRKIRVILAIVSFELTALQLLLIRLQSTHTHRSTRTQSDEAVAIAELHVDGATTAVACRRLTPDCRLSTHDSPDSPDRYGRALRLSQNVQQSVAINFNNITECQ